jgi:hypothetical protein
MAQSNNVPAGKVVQFNWRRHWSKKVVPHLHKELVQFSVDFGMTILNPKWKRGDPPYMLGSVPPNRRRVVPGTLEWYQVRRRCHWISFFSMAIGVLNYPDLDWRFVSGEWHTVPVGYVPKRVSNSTSRGSCRCSVPRLCCLLPPNGPDGACS